MTIFQHHKQKIELKATAMGTPKLKHIYNQSRPALRAEYILLVIQIIIFCMIFLCLGQKLTPYKLSVLNYFLYTIQPLSNLPIMISRILIIFFFLPTSQAFRIVTVTSFTSASHPSSRSGLLFKRHRAITYEFLELCFQKFNMCVIGFYAVTFLIL